MQVRGVRVPEIRHPMGGVSAAKGGNRMGLLVTLGWVALVVGVVLIVLGYTAAAAALRPGWGVFILGLILLLIGYLVPVLAVGRDHVDTAQVSVAA